MRCERIKVLGIAGESVGGRRGLAVGVGVGEAASYTCAISSLITVLTIDNQK
jgi:hypothetical protein